MGLKNSSTTFQQCLETVLEGIEGVKIYQDDILIHASSLSKLKNRANAVLSRLRSAKVSLNEKKSIQRFDNFDFLGFNISGKGILPSQ